MALSKDTLAQALDDLFQGKPFVAGKPAFPADAPAAGDAWANAYAGYANGASAGVTLPGPGAISGKQSDLGKALGKAFAGGPTGTPAPPAMDAAFSIFWAAMPFAGPGAVGAVSVVPPPPTLAGALATVFAAGVPATGPAPSAADQASAIAGALHKWTTSILVGVSTGGSPPVPTKLA